MTPQPHDEDDAQPILPVVSAPYDPVANMLGMFLQGNSIASIAQSFDMHPVFVEGVIRLALNRGRPAGYRMRIAA